MQNKNELLAFYKDHLQNDLMHFWIPALDTRYGGVFTCYSNDGRQLLSTDKYVWSQGRMIWILSRYGELIQKGLLEGDAAPFLAQARRTWQFLRKNAILPEGEGVCAYLLEQDGTKKESIPGKGYYTSFYVDCFVIMGFAEYARVSGEKESLEEAYAIYLRTRQYLARGEIVSEPYPMPEGFSSHSIPMIMSNTCFTLYEAMKALGYPAAEQILEDAGGYLEDSMHRHYNQSRGVIVEMLPLRDELKDTMLATHVNPGHAIESMWFFIKVSQLLGREDYFPQIFTVVRNSIRAGWDSQYGGLLRIAGEDGQEPKGRLLGDPYETLMCETWDTKLWWPHSEALYTTLLCASLSGDAEFEGLFQKIHEYVFRVFPNSDREVGEWIQILDRGGTPMDKVVALPVKDPYHITRNVMLIIELLADWQKP